MITDVLLGNTQLVTDQRFCLAISNLGFPTISNSYQEKGSFLGRKLSKANIRSYTFSTEWIIRGSSIPDFATQRDEFLKILGTILSEGSKTLKITKANNVAVQIEVKSVRVTGDVNASNKVAANFLVEFDAEYPFLQSQNEIIQEITIFSGGGMAIPMAIPMNMAVGGSSTMLLQNLGSYESYPIITFNAPIQNPTLANLTTGKTLNLTYDLTGSNYIVIDTFLRTATLYPANTNVRQYISGDFFTLAVGDNNIKLSSAVYNSQGKAVIRYRSTYLGI